MWGRMTLELSSLWLADEADAEPIDLPFEGATVRFEGSSGGPVLMTAVKLLEIPEQNRELIERLLPKAIVQQRASEREMRRPLSAGQSLRSIPFGDAEAWFIRPDPTEFAELFDRTEHELRSALHRAAGLVRWHFNLDISPRLLDRARLELSLDTTGWYRLLRLVDLEWEFGDSVELDDLGFVASSLNEGAEVEPLAREVFVEAAALFEDNPRAALVLGVTAVEVAVRSFTSSTGGQDAAWLLSRPQAPAIDELLANFLPFVTPIRTRDGKVVPKELRRIIRDGVEGRNNVVHFGEPGFDRDRLSTFLEATNDLLYLLDWFAGEAWALDHVSARWRSAYAAAGGTKEPPNNS